MQAYDYGDEKVPDGCIDDRDYRALTRSLSVLPDEGRADGADDLFTVVSDSGSEYLVDVRLGACECSDHEYRDIKCLHVRRVEFATGERKIPAGVDRDDVDEVLGIHTEGEPRFAGDVATDGGEIVEAGDEGEILEDEKSAPTERSEEPEQDYTYHREPPKVGGARYARCEHCGAESVPARPDRVLHREGCPLGDRR